MSEVLHRNRAFGRVWTRHAEPLSPSELSDALAARGFVPGVRVGEGPILTEAGLDGVALTVGGEAIRFLSLSSSRGEGCTLRVVAASESPLPDDPLARRRMIRPYLTYEVQAGGPSNSDRNLCENLAEELMLRTEGLAELSGRGTRGNRPVLYDDVWIGR